MAVLFGVFMPTVCVLWYVHFGYGMCDNSTIRINYCRLECDTSSPIDDSGLEHILHSPS